MIKKVLFKAAKSPFMGGIVGTAFRFCSRIIPVRKVYNDRKVIAFYHPKPSYENHLIISPKKAIKNLQILASENNSKYFIAIMNAAASISDQRPEFGKDFTVVANGGKKQEVQQVHFHMFTNHKFATDPPPEPPENVIYRDEKICIFEHPDHDWDLHVVIMPNSNNNISIDEDYKHQYLADALQRIDILNEKFNIAQKGYSFVCQFDRREEQPPIPAFHLVSGRRPK